MRTLRARTGLARAAGRMGTSDNLRYQQSIVLWGDSISAQNGAGTTALDGASDVVNAVGYWHWANMYMGQRFTLAANKGVGGERTDQILARFAADIAAVPSGWVCIQAGTNDIGQGVAAATIISNLQTMINSVLGIGRGVLLLTVAPATPYNTVEEKAVYAAVNNWILSQASSRVIVADVAATYQDPGDTSQPLAGFTQDGTHPTCFGAQRWGECIAAALLPVTREKTIEEMLGVASLTPAWSHDGFASFSGWANFGLAVGSVAGGKMLIDPVGRTTATDSGVQKATNISSGLVAPGDIVRAAVLVKWTNVVPHSAYSTTQMYHFPYLRVQFRNVDSSYTTNTIYGMNMSSSAARLIDISYADGSGEGVLITSRGTVGANVANIYVTLGWIGAASGALEFSDLQVWKE